MIHYYRFRILLYPLQTTVANPCIPSYNLTPSILFHQIPLRNIILSQLFLLTQDIDTAAQFSNLSTNSPLLQLFHFGASSSLDFSLAYFPSKFVPASIVADTTEKTTKTYCCRSWNDFFRWCKAFCVSPNISISTFTTSVNNYFCLNSISTDYSPLSISFSLTYLFPSGVFLDYFPTAMSISTADHWVFLNS